MISNYANCEQEDASLALAETWLCDNLLFFAAESGSFSVAFLPSRGSALLADAVQVTAKCFLLPR